MAVSRGARAGAENVLARLSELMFVEAVRHYLEGAPRGRVTIRPGVTASVHIAYTAAP